jgi:hypothetical protein
VADAEYDAPSIAIAGDVTVDWLLALPEAAPPDAASLTYVWETEAGPSLSSQAGGAALVGDILRAAGQVDAHQITLSSPEPTQQALIDPSNRRYVRSFSTWKRVPSEVGSRDRVWRMDRFLGWHRAADDSEADDVSILDPRSTCLFVEDGNQRFQRHSQAWEGLLSLDPRHVVIRQTGGLGTGALWKALAEQFPGRLTLICAVNDLRREGAPIGRPLSWERTAQDVLAAVKSRPGLDHALRVVVLLATSGAVVVERDGPSSLVFDPLHQEGDWGRAYLGVGYGAGTCGVASILVEYAARPDSPDVGEAARRGLIAARELVSGGFHATIDDAGWKLRFPVERIATAIARDQDEASPIRVATIAETPGWRLFETAISGGFRDAAAQIALFGEDAVSQSQDVPIERMGAWTSVDRIEIESMRSVRNIIGEYLAGVHKRRPLNLAVFGPPGSGKSFAIKQMAKELATEGARVGVLEFNVSQFKSASDLPPALQQVRDMAVQETLPLVFWDEFDAMLDGRELGWLTHFLAPMQDGTFTEEGRSRPVGPAIFVFAGGTHATMDAFRQRATAFSGAKATDFLSRLRGYVDILGPNPFGEGDQTYPLRRAMLLRAILLGRAPALFQKDNLRVDHGILRAFLDVPQYFHGSRSMESIIDMSSLHGGLSYERSALPAVHQLALHVDAEAFIRLVREG